MRVTVCALLYATCSNTSSLFPKGNISWNICYVNVSRDCSKKLEEGLHTELLLFVEQIHGEVENLNLSLKLIPNGKILEAGHRVQMSWKNGGKKGGGQERWKKLSDARLTYFYHLFGSLWRVLRESTQQEQGWMRHSAVPWAWGTARGSSLSKRHFPASFWAWECDSRDVTLISFTIITSSLALVAGLEQKRRLREERNHSKNGVEPMRGISICGVNRECWGQNGAESPQWSCLCPEPCIHEGLAPLQALLQ